MSSSSCGALWGCQYGVFVSADGRLLATVTVGSGATVCTPNETTNLMALIGVLGIADRSQASKSGEPVQGAIAQVTGGMLRLDGVEISGTETKVSPFNTP